MIYGAFTSVQGCDKGTAHSKKEGESEEVDDKIEEFKRNKKGGRRQRKQEKKTRGGRWDNLLSQRGRSKRRSEKVKTRGQERGK